MSQQLIALIDEQIETLQAARKLLTGEGAVKPQVYSVSPVSIDTGRKHKRHTMSPEGRKRIAAAQRKRWKLKRAAAEVKAAAKKESAA